MTGHVQLPTVGGAGPDETYDHTYHRKLWSQHCLGSYRLFLVTWQQLEHTNTPDTAASICWADLRPAGAGR